MKLPVDAFSKYVVSILVKYFDLFMPLKADCSEIIEEGRTACNTGANSRTFYNKALSTHL